MMRDVWGRPAGLRSPSPSDVQRPPPRPVREPAREPAREPVQEAARELNAAQVDESLAEARAQLAAARAEIEASRARLQREAARERDAERLRLVGEVLPVLDDLDRSIAAAHADGDVKDSLVEGFELVRARLERVLHGYGLERIPSVGERFDPALHEAIALVDVDDDALVGAVVDEMSRGYQAGGRVLRPARVRVGAAS